MVNLEHQGRAWEAQDMGTIRAYRCTVCPYETDDMQGAVGHAAGPSSGRGWFGEGEAHIVTPRGCAVCGGADDGPMHPAATLTGGTIPSHTPGAYPSLSCCGGTVALVDSESLGPVVNPDGSPSDVTLYMLRGRVPVGTRCQWLARCTGTAVAYRVGRQDWTDGTTGPWAVCADHAEDVGR